MPAVVELAASRRMSESDYEAAREQLRATYGDSSTEAAAHRDRAMALLFLQSGWTQEELAKKEGMSREWVLVRLRFGRFLNYVTSVTSSNYIPKRLTEGRFRSYWSQTGKNDGERARFRAVMQLIGRGGRGQQTSFMTAAAGWKPVERAARLHNLILA